MENPEFSVRFYLAAMKGPRQKNLARQVEKLYDIHSKKLCQYNSYFISGGLRIRSDVVSCLALKIRLRASSLT